MQRGIPGGLPLSFHETFPAPAKRGRGPGSQPAFKKPEWLFPPGKSHSGFCCLVRAPSAVTYTGRSPGIFSHSLYSSRLTFGVNAR